MQIVCISIYVSIQGGVGLITECTLVHKDIIKETTLWSGNVKANMSLPVMRFKRIICLTRVSRYQLLNKNGLHTLTCDVLNYKCVEMCQAVFS